MDVSFERTGERRYATVIILPGRHPRRMDPAPGYDDHIPHDLVHYLAEAETGLTSGVFGRAAAGGGGFAETVETPGDPRRRAREQRRLRKREAFLNRNDPGDMGRSEYLAGLCDLAWRRRAGAQAPGWAGHRPIPPGTGRWSTASWPGWTNWRRSGTTCPSARRSPSPGPGRPRPPAVLPSPPAATGPASGTARPAGGSRARCGARP